MPNQLAQETSPYLLQHAENPVDWRPWNAEALEESRREDRPIFLSIGYSACHWCHVMEHESFENAEIARQLNESFVNIKVDREERPDLDQVYMQAVQMLTGRGGWPMSVFLTPDLEPFFGGTYWPPSRKMGMPGFDEVIAAVRDAWSNRRDEVREAAGRLREGIVQTGQLGDVGDAEPPLSREPLQAAEAALERIFDHAHGGFGGAPKFPHPMDLRLLLRQHGRQPRESLLAMVRLTLDKMAAGGLYDHLGGGFHRYSVDERWLAPHFEKMLYDNALLAVCYLETYQATGEAHYAQVTREVLDYVLREMTGPTGGFFSTQDADTEGAEGKFYLWTPAEVREVLGPEAAEVFSYVYDVSEAGNFEERNILNLPKTIEQCAQLKNRDLAELKSLLDEARAKLLAARNTRVRPGLDDKVLVGWNGLTIDAFAQAAGVLAEPKYLDAARRAADFILTELRGAEGKLLHTWRGGQAKFDAYLDDYAAFAGSLVSLYEASFEPRWLAEAIRLTDVMLEKFHDGEGGAFYYTAADQEPLIPRRKDVQDGSVPSGNSLAATLLVRLGRLCGRSDYLEAAERTFQACRGLLEKHPTAMGQMLLALDAFLGPAHELVLAADPADAETTAVATDLRRRYLPRKALAFCPVGDAVDGPLKDLCAGKQAVSGRPTLYICENFTCGEPVVGAENIAAACDRLAGPIHD